MGPAAPRHVGSSQTRARTRVPCIGRQTLNHCATREALFCLFLIGLFVFSLMLSYMSCLYIGHIIWKYFLPFSRLSFCFVYGFLCCAKVFTFSWSRLFIFAFISFALGDGSKKYWCNLCQSVLPMFSSRSFIVSGLTFRSLIHFEFIFVYGVRECSNFVLFFFLSFFKSSAY